MEEQQQTNQQQPQINNQQQPVIPQTTAEVEPQPVILQTTAEVEPQPVIPQTTAEVEQPVQKMVEQAVGVEISRNSQPQSQPLLVYNPSLRLIPRHEPADVIPSQQDSSLIDWLEISGRMLPRDPSETDTKYLEVEEEFPELTTFEDNSTDDEESDTDED